MLKICMEKKLYILGVDDQITNLLHQSLKAITCLVDVNPILDSFDNAHETMTVIGLFYV